MPTLELPPELCYSQAEGILGQLQQAALSGNEQLVYVNAAPLQKFDSSALAVLLELRRFCQRHAKALLVEHVSADLRALAQLYGVFDLLTPAPSPVSLS